MTNFTVICQIDGEPLEVVRVKAETLDECFQSAERRLRRYLDAKDRRGFKVYYVFTGFPSMAYSFL